MTDGPAGPQADALVRRLRAWPRSSWRQGARLAATRWAVQTLADLAAVADDRTTRSVPDAGEYAVADQLVVMIADARSAGVAPADLESVMAELARELGFR